MDKLKNVIKEYGRWSGLEPYINYIETYIKIDFSLSLENAKSLLETVGSTVSIKNSLVSKSTLLLRCLISSNGLPCEVKPISFLSLVILNSFS
jgi:hypothetical protein